MTLRVVLVLVAMEFSFFGLCGCHQQIGWLWILAGPAQSNRTSSRFFFFFPHFLDILDYFSVVQ